MYRDLISQGWKHKDIDEMDINHFMEIMYSDEENNDTSNGNSKTLNKNEIEDWFKKI